MSLGKVDVSTGETENGTSEHRRALHTKQKWYQNDENLMRNPPF